MFTGDIEVIKIFLDRHLNKKLVLEKIIPFESFLKVVLF